MAIEEEDSPSLVMKEMNSLTHSCMHSFASFAILALSGSAIFMMRATGAKLRMLASEAAAFWLVFLGVVCGGEVEECGDGDDMAGAAGLGSLRYAATLSGSRQVQRSSGSLQRRSQLAIGG